MHTHACGIRPSIHPSTHPPIHCTCAEVEEGGETCFPRGTWLNATLQRRGPYSSCGARGVAMRPQKGDAVLFWSLQPDGE
jgi:hypothetical protein